MGNKSEKEIRTMISNEISTQITNRTKNISDVFNQPTTKISTDMVNQAAAKIDIKTITSNLLKAKDITAVGSSINIEQDAKVQATNQAIIQIIGDQSQMNEMANKVASEMSNKAQNDATVKQSLDAISKIGENTKNAGGPEQMVDKVLSTVGDMIKNLTQIGGSSSEKQITEIKNKISVAILNEVENKTNIKNIIDNVVSSSFKQAAEAKCDMNTDTQNTIDVGNLTALALAGKSGDINIKQSVSVDAFNTCFIKMEMGQKVASKLMNGYEFKSANDTANSAKTDSGLEAKSEVTKTTEQESAIMKSVDNAVNKITGIIGNFMAAPMYAIIGCAACCMCIIVLPMLMPSGRSGGNDDMYGGSFVNLEDTITFEGGGFNLSFDEGKMYLYVAILAALLFIYSKSIPMCGVALAVLVGFILYQNKKILTPTPTP
jgi:hypothetical protein